MLLLPREAREFVLGRRSFTAPVEIGKFEHRSSTNELTIGGLAAVYESRSELLFGCFYEEIAKGAFRKALSRNPDVVCVFDHDGMPLARTYSGTLTLRDSPQGLQYEARMSGDIQQARDLYAAIERGDVHQSSFSFTVERNGGDEWRYEAVDGYDLRRIMDVGELYDVSPVGRPAYAAATVTARDVTTNTESPAFGNSREVSELQQGGGGDGQQSPTEGRSDDLAGTDVSADAEARIRALQILRFGVPSNESDRTAERGN